MTEIRTAAETTTPALAFDNPEAYIAGDRRRALAAGVELPDRVNGAALFADVSGFTPLTEALAAELGPQRGAEELTACLNLVFHSVIAELDRFGGDVIYFSGDAITCWLDGDDGSRATACALAMQETMERIGDEITYGTAGVRLAMKVAVAVGDARRFVVGDPEIQLIDVLAGRLIDELAAAEQQAGQGEVVLDQSALDSLGDRVEIGERRVDADSGRTVGVATRLPNPPAELPVVEEERLPEDVVRPWILPVVYERLRTGRGEFLAELRPAVSLFVQFGGIDYDADDAVAKLDDFVRRAQRICSDYGGNVLQITIGDKGAYVYAVFGSPHAHEDDGARAAAAALELRELDQVTAAADLKIGIASGRLRSGTYGHAMRRTFVCLGDAVNLAARLMSQAPPGKIYVGSFAKGLAGDSFAWESLPPLRLKGKAEPVAVYSLTGGSGHGAQRHRRYEHEILGRRNELGALSNALDRTLEGRGNTVGISAEAGLGKSRLVAEFVRGVRAGGGLVAFGECPAFGTHADYFVWQEIWRSLLRVDARLGEEEQRLALVRGLEAIDPALVQRAPLLGPVLGIAIPENDLTTSFDAKLRKTSLESLLAECLRARAADELVVIVLEDCHWIGPLARDLLTALVRASAALPVLFVLAYRPAAAPGGGLGIEQLNSVRRARAGRARARRRGGPDPLQARAAVRRRRVRVSTARRARHGALAGEPVLRRGAAQLPPQPGARSPRRGGAAWPRAAREPAQPDSQPRRHARRGAPQHLEGRKRSRPLVPGPDAPGRLSGARLPGRRHGAPRTAPRARAGHPRPRGRPVVPLQARRHPGSGVRDDPVRDPRATPRAGRRTTSSGRRPTRSGSSSTCSPTTTGTARTWRRSASTSCAPARRPRPRTRTPPRSTISSGQRRSSARASASTCS